MITKWFLFCQSLKDEYDKDGVLLGEYVYNDEGPSVQVFPVQVSKTDKFCLGTNSHEWGYLFTLFITAKERVSFDELEKRATDYSRKGCTKRASDDARRDCTKNATH